MADVAHILSKLPTRHVGTGDTVPYLAPTGWHLDSLAGRLTELTANNSPAVLSAAMSLVREAQINGEPAVWITPLETLFFPPDVAKMGIDLAALTVVQVPFSAMAKAADRVIRSGGFGLVVLDMVTEKGRCPGLPMRSGGGWLSRLGGLANRHDTAVLFLTHGDEGGTSLGVLVSLRGEARRLRVEADRFNVDIRVTKNKRGTYGQHHRESCYGPAGLC